MKQWQELRKYNKTKREKERNKEGSITGIHFLGGSRRKSVFLGDLYILGDSRRLRPLSLMLYKFHVFSTTKFASEKICYLSISE